MTAALADYEFHVYGADADGNVPAQPIRIEKMTCTGERAAKNVAKRYCLEVRGPVDVARFGPSPWNDRYIGTASPKYGGQSKATVFERLD